MTRIRSRRPSVPVCAGASLLAAMVLPSCMMRETVRDSHGNIIYQETVHGSPFEREETRTDRIIRREDELGY